MCMAWMYRSRCQWSQSSRDVYLMKIERRGDLPCAVTVVAISISMNPTSRWNDYLPGDVKDSLLANLHLWDTLIPSCTCNQLQSCESVKTAGAETYPWWENQHQSGSWMEYHAWRKSRNWPGNQYNGSEDKQERANARKIGLVCLVVVLLQPSSVVHGDSLALSRGRTRALRSSSLGDTHFSSGSGESARSVDSSTWKLTEELGHWFCLFDGGVL